MHTTNVFASPVTDHVLKRQAKRLHKAIQDLDKVPVEKRTLTFTQDFLAQHVWGLSNWQELVRLLPRKIAADSDQAAYEADLTTTLMEKIRPHAKGADVDVSLLLCQAVCRVLVHRHLHEGLVLTCPMILESMRLESVENFYLEGYRRSEEKGGFWPDSHVRIRDYLHFGLPGYDCQVLLTQHGFGEKEPTEIELMMRAFRGGAPADLRKPVQIATVKERHARYLVPVFLAVNALNQQQDAGRTISLTNS